MDIILDLEAQRYNAMLANSVERVAGLLHMDLVYTHSFGERDTKDSYLRKLAEGYFRYHEIEHEVERVLEAGECIILVGSMRATTTVGETIRHIHNANMAVWCRQGGIWTLLAYQPRPLPSHATGLAK